MLNLGKLIYVLISFQVSFGLKVINLFVPDCISWQSEYKFSKVPDSKNISGSWYAGVVSAFVVVVRLSNVPCCQFAKFG